MKRRIKLFTITMLILSLFSSTVFAATTTIPTNSVLSLAAYYVQLSEQYKTGVGTQLAANEIALLPNGADKTKLTARLQAVYDYIEKTREANATAAVTNAEKLKNSTVAMNSISLINLVTNTAVKNALLQRVYNIVTTPALATKYVQYAALAKSAQAKQLAQMYTNGLKDVTLKGKLQNQLDAIK